MSHNQDNSVRAIEKAIEKRRLWMQALAGKVSKQELDEKGFSFIAVVE